MRMRTRSKVRRFGGGSTFPLITPALAATAKENEVLLTSIPRPPPTTYDPASFDETSNFPPITVVKCLAATGRSSPRVLILSA
ncbi:hypothetical protein LZ31DRAFT_555525 [Colletotrichum somersetense]|nr:hypothetical protein LZ31DRAFT_555525 [Colletotrichum somersetense]